uniref:Amine oxidase domain-containing protein n=1 Tax=Xenopus tropicalis TaxID=8364 RepID=A0A803J9P8_XENTR
MLVLWGLLLFLPILGLYLWFYHGWGCFFREDAIQPTQPLVTDKRARDKVLRQGVPPNDSSFMINSLLLHHYKRGAWYPRGGSSEIPFHMINVIERAGGKVLVKAPVTRILLSNGRATGVAVKKSGQEICVSAPIIISDAGIFNTYERLLPPEIKQKPEVASILSRLQYGMGCFLVFVGLRGTSDELGLKSINYWIIVYQSFTDIAFFCRMDQCSLSTLDEFCENLPLMFITSPSAKDPTYNLRHPGRSCMTLLTMAPYHWFSEWKEHQPRHRGDDYYNMKMKLAQKMLERALKENPQLEDKVKSATPLSNEYYLRAPKGSMYSAEQNCSRYQSDIIVKMRTQTAVPGLYLTGQDVFSSGLAGAVHGGLLCACAVLNRILYLDLIIMKKRLKRQRMKKRD